MEKVRLNFDDVLRHLGEFGRYQKWMSFLLCLPGLSYGVRMMISVFLLNVPKHRCALPGYDNDTYDVQSDHHAYLINATIPYVMRDGKQQLDRCHIYSDSSDITNVSASRAVHGCNKWVYDKSVFEFTASMEFSFVCDDAILATHCKMIYMFGCFFGAFAAGTLGDKIGRKKALYLCIVLLTAGGILLNWSSNFVMFVILRFINGASATGIYSTSFVIGMEVVGPSWRVFTGAFIPIFFAIGMTMLSGVAFFIRDWHTLELIMAAPVGIFLLYWWLIPESPRWLLNEFRYEEAEVIIRRAADVNKVTLPDNFFEQAEKTEDETTDTPKGNFFQLFTTPVMSLQWVTVLLAMIGKLGAASGFAIIYIFSSELFPTVIRHSASGASSSFARVGGMIAPYIADWGKFVGGDFGRALPLLMFGSLSVLAGLLVLLLPETLNRDLPETIEDGIKFGRKPICQRSTDDEEGQQGLSLLAIPDSTGLDENHSTQNRQQPLDQANI